jgi:hypothetical protein
MNLGSRMFVDDILETQVEEDNGAVECNGSPVTRLQDSAAFTNVAGLRSSNGRKNGVIFLLCIRWH